MAHRWHDSISYKVQRHIPVGKGTSAPSAPQISVLKVTYYTA